MATLISRRIALAQSRTGGSTTCRSRTTSVNSIGRWAADLTGIHP